MEEFGFHREGWGGALMAGLRSHAAGVEGAPEDEEREDFRGHVSTLQGLSQGVCCKPCSEVL